MNERVFRHCLTDIHFKGLSKSLGIDPFAAVLVDHDALPSRFKQIRYPQMLSQLHARGERATQPELSAHDPLPPTEHQSVEAPDGYQRDAPEIFALDEDLDIDR